MISDLSSLTHESKTCLQCLIDKGLTEYYVSKRGKLGRNSICKECQKSNARKRAKANREKETERQREYRRRYPERAKAAQKKYDEKRKEHKSNYSRMDRSSNPRKYRDKKLRSLYGMTVNEVDRILALQHFKCLSCGIAFADSGIFQLAVDHCHKLGHVRGIICQRCNLTEGLIQTPDEGRQILKYMLENELLSYQGKQ